MAQLAAAASTRTLASVPKSSYGPPRIQCVFSDRTSDSCCVGCRWDAGGPSSTVGPLGRCEWMRGLTRNPSQRTFSARAWFVWNCLWFVRDVPNRLRRPSRTARETFYSTLRRPNSTLCSGGGERRCALGLAGPCPRMPINARSRRETCTNSLFSFRRPLRLPPRCAVGTRGAAVGKSTGGVALRHPRYGVRVVS